MIKLYLMDGVDEIQSFDLPGDTVHVGRSSENQIRMKDGYVSGSHLKIIEKGTGILCRTWAAPMAPL